MSSEVSEGITMRKNRSDPRAGGTKNKDLMFSQEDRKKIDELESAIEKINKEAEERKRAEEIKEAEAKKAAIKKRIACETRIEAKRQRYKLISKSIEEG